MLNWFENLTFFEFAAFLTAANIAMYIGSWIAVFVVQRFYSAFVLNPKKPVVTRRDYLLSFLIVAINISVGIPGWWLWKNGFIELAESELMFGLIDLISIFFFFDLSMYCLHRLMHWGWLYRLFHRRHHDHVDVNGISFYVMNPAEALGFGFLLIGFLLVRPFSIHALLIYLSFNWAYGTMGHSGVPIKNKILFWLVGDTEFHHTHHSKLRGNYGFYTGLWDRIFGTKIAN